ncbi:hypothetical protein [Thermococcus sp.]|uniref:hypothetical protein n=1 Tax=Thermococcus sp. TaxID=35749 RepID=UPI0026390083|nr:hypothetical protein [Thermococcus sp.]
MKRGLALAVTLLLVGSVIPLGLATNTTASNATGSTSVLLDNTTREGVIATQLIKELQRLASFAEKKIEPIKDRLPQNSSIIKYYELAEEYRGKALEEYNESDYHNSILDSLTAMHYYKRALSRLREGRERVEEAKAHVRAQAERMNEYLAFVRKVITLAQEQGIDITNLSRAYNETVEAYKTVLNDLREKNLTRAREDLEVLREKMILLNNEFRMVRRELAYKNADKIVSAFLRKGERGIEIAEKAIEFGENKGYNVTELKERLDAFKALYEQVKNLSAEGKYDEALSLIQENGETIAKFHGAITFVMRKVHEREVQKRARNMKAFLREIADRIQKDRRALEGLEKKGVDTRRAELQLKVAVEELKLGVELARHGEPAKAKAHFEIALDLLNRVEGFILTHS